MTSSFCAKVRQLLAYQVGASYVPWRGVPEEELQILPLLSRWGWYETLEGPLGHLCVGETCWNLNIYTVQQHGCFMACCVHGAWVYFPRYCTSGSCTTPDTLGDVYDEDETACHENKNQKATWFPFMGLQSDGYQKIWLCWAPLFFKLINSAFLSDPFRLNRSVKQQWKRNWGR